MKRRIYCDTTEAQYNALQDVYTKFLYMSGGYGSGKTYALVLKPFQLMDLNPGITGGILSPDNKMFKRDVLPTIRDIAGTAGIEFNYNKQEGSLYFPATKNLVYIYHAMDDGVSIRGPNQGWGLVNEASLCSWLAFKAFIARVRLKSAKFPQVFASGTPEDFNWVYQFFIDTVKTDRKIIYASTRGNRHTAEWYVNMLEESYDSIAKQQYVDGLYIPSTGNRFLHTFNRHRHVSTHAERVPGAQVWVMADFNVNPMVATIASYVPHSPVKLRIFDEVVISGADTYMLAEQLKYKIGSDYKSAVVFPDPAGRGRHTSSKDLVTDLGILKSEGFEDLRYKSKLSVKDCYFAANNLIDKNQVAVHPKCKELIADFEQVKVKDGAFEMEKTDKQRTHALDGFKNMADYMFPAVKSFSEVRSIVIR